MFIGDSLTYNYNLAVAFPSRSYINAGVPAQSAQEMPARFDRDVVQNHPAVVVILAGTNDVYWLGANLDLSHNAIVTMIETAFSARITPILCSIPPMRGAAADRNARVQDWNARLKSYAAGRGVEVADYYSVLVDASGMLRAEYAYGDNHLNDAGYAAITPVISARLMGH